MIISPFHNKNLRILILLPLWLSATGVRWRERTWTGVGCCRVRSFTRPSTTRRGCYSSLLWSTNRLWWDYRCSSWITECADQISYLSVALQIKQCGFNGVNTLAVPAPGQGPGPEPEQWGTIGVSPCPCSGEVWKVLHKTVEPIYSCLGPSSCPGTGDSKCNWTIRPYSAYV